MSCYLRHLRDVFEALGLDYDRSNRARVDDAVRAVLGVGHDASCPQVWAAVKALPDAGRRELADRVSERLA